MVVTETTLVDTSLNYAAVDDVESYFEDRNFDSSTSPTKTQVEQHISEVSDYIDNTTKRAWRTRKVEALTLSPKFSYKQQSQRHRRRSLRGNGGRQNFNMARRARVQLPHLHVKDFDSAKGDKVEVLSPRSVKDITDNEGRSDGQFVVNYRRGALRVDLDLFEIGAGTFRNPGAIPEEVGVRVTYRYGRPATDSDNNGVPDELPGDIRRACAKLVAADLINGDQYGDFVPGGDGSVAPDTASKRWEKGAESTLDNYRRNAAPLQ